MKATLRRSPPWSFHFGAEAKEELAGLWRAHRKSKLTPELIASLEVALETAVVLARSGPLDEGDVENAESLAEVRRLAGPLAKACEILRGLRPDTRVLLMAGVPGASPDRLDRVVELLEGLERFVTAAASIRLKRGPHDRADEVLAHEVARWLEAHGVPTRSYDDGLFAVLLPVVFKAAGLRRSDNPPMSLVRRVVAARAGFLGVSKKP